jgi:AcrR family transcriptional regulator
MRDEFSYAAKQCSDATGGQVKPGIFRVCLNTAALEYARVVLDRWRTPNLKETRSSLGAEPVTAPAGEVAELVPEDREPASVMGEPSDEELLELHDWMTDEWAANHDFELPPSQFARAVLARYGRPAPAPAGEVAELVRKLREQAAAYNAHPGHEPLIEEWARCFTRAADLLERQAAPVPVASDVHFEFVVSDADYCTQAGGIAPTYAQAVSEGQHYLAQYQQDGLHTLEVRRVEVLPLPSEEVQG